MSDSSFVAWGSFMDFRYHIDPDTDLPHIYGHGVTEADLWSRLSTSGASRFGRIQGGATMSESRFPAGWDAERVKRLIDYYEGLSEDEQVAEDEAAIAAERQGQAVIAVPDELLPEIRRLLAAYQAKSA